MNHRTLFVVAILLPGVLCAGVTEMPRMRRVAEQASGSSSRATSFFDARVPEALGGAGESIGDVLHAVGDFAAGIHQLIWPSRAELPTVRATSNAKQKHQTVVSAAAVVETGCEPGVMMWLPQIRDTCATGTVCTVLEAQCNGSAVSLWMTANELRRNPTCTVTQLYCDSLAVDLAAQFGATDCRVKKTFCMGDTAIGLCSVQVVCNPDFITFGKEAFAFVCSHQELVCNDSVVDDVEQYDNDTLPEDCYIRTSRCTTDDETCLALECTNETTPCTFRIVAENPCDTNCTRLVNTTFCTCPADFSGNRCKESANITCTAFIVEPQPECIATGSNDSDTKEANLTYDRACFVFERTTENVPLVANISCRFTDTTLNNLVNLGNFSYWLETASLKLSSDPDWRVRAKFFNFDRLSDDSFAFLLQLTRDQLRGTELVRFDLPLKPLNESHRPGDRVYLELGFGTENAPHGMTNKAMRRMHFDIEAKVVVAKTGLTGGEIAGISVAGAVAIIAVVVTIIVLAIANKKRTTKRKSSK